MYTHLSSQMTRSFPPPLSLYLGVKSVCKKKKWAWAWTRLKMSNVTCRHHLLVEASSWDMGSYFYCCINPVNLLDTMLSIRFTVEICNYSGVVVWKCLFYGISVWFCNAPPLIVYISVEALRWRQSFILSYLKQSLVNHRCHIVQMVAQNSPGL